MSAPEVVGSSGSRARLRRIDTHCHFFRTGYEESGRSVQAGEQELKHYEQLRAEYGIVRALVIAYEGQPWAVGNNRYVGELADRFDWVVPTTYWNPLRVEGDQAGSSSIAMYADDADGGRAAGQFLGGRGQNATVVSLNARPAALFALAPTILAMRDTWFLISHMGLPGALRAGDCIRDRLAPLLSLQQNPNVTVKLSGQYAATDGSLVSDIRVQEAVDIIADSFGTDRLVWGSDFPPVLKHSARDEAPDCTYPSGVSAAERHAIDYVNAASRFERFEL